MQEGGNNMSEEAIALLINMGICGLIVVYMLYSKSPKSVDKEKKVEPNKQLEYIGSIMSVLEHQINMSETAREPVDITDWEERIGVLISREDAEAIVGFYYSIIQENENKV